MSTFKFNVRNDRSGVSEPDEGEGPCFRGVAGRRETLLGGWTKKVVDIQKEGVEGDGEEEKD